MQYQGHTLRHEMKYYINKSVYHTLRNRLKTVIFTDSNMKREEGYLVSSLYFDDMYQSALEEKQSGIRFRKKFRIRCYDLEDKYIRLECKKKYHEFISKTSASLTRAEYDCILAGNYEFLGHRKEQVCKELLAYNKTRLMKPKVVVEYMREAYVLPTGNVRITFDKDISASIGNYDMFAKDYMTRKVLEEEIMVMEIKFDDFLPTHVMSILKTAMTNKCAISKYVMCREEKRRVQLR